MAKHFTQVSTHWATWFAILTLTLVPLCSVSSAAAEAVEHDVIRMYKAPGVPGPGHTWTLEALWPTPRPTLPKCSQLAEDHAAASVLVVFLIVGMSVMGADYRNFVKEFEKDGDGTSDPPSAVETSIDLFLHPSLTTTVAGLAVCLSMASAPGSGLSVRDKGLWVVGSGLQLSQLSSGTTPPDGVVVLLMFLFVVVGLALMYTDYLEFLEDQNEQDEVHDSSKMISTAEKKGIAALPYFSQHWRIITCVVLLLSMCVSTAITLSNGM